MSTITVRLTLDNVLTELKPGDVFTDDPEFGTILSVRMHSNGLDAVVYNDSRGKDTLGLPQTVRITR